MVPCTWPDVVDTYRDVVRGLITGAYRIREHYRADRAFTAELQRPVADGWETIDATRWLTWPFPDELLRRSYRTGETTPLPQFGVGR
jgi:hypothetical protein